MARSCATRDANNNKNTGAVEGINMPMLADGAGAVSTGAVVRSSSSRYSLILVRNFSSEKFSFCSTSSWKNSLLISAQRELQDSCRSRTRDPVKECLFI